MASKTKKSAKKTVCSICKNEIVFPCDVFKDGRKTICRRCNDRKEANRRRQLLKSKLSNPFDVDMAILDIRTMRRVETYVKMWVEREGQYGKSVLEPMLKYLNETINDMKIDIETIAKENKCQRWLKEHKKEIDSL